MSTIIKPQSHHNMSAAKKPMDRMLFLLTLLLLGIGIVTVFDASYALALEHRHGDSFYYVKLQAAWAVVGLAALLATWRVRYWKWRRFAGAGAAVSVLLLLAVLVPHIGISVAGARRWVGHGPIRIQPSEVAKLMLVLYIAHVAAARPKLMRLFKQGIGPLLGVVGVMFLLVAKEPDLGTGMVLGGTGLVMLFLAGARPRHMAALLACVALGGGVYGAFLAKPYQRERLVSFANPQAHQIDSGYQVWHALIALGSGGPTGLGLGEGREKLYLPMARTDFIFPVIAEEWGLFGTLALVTVFVLIAARGFLIAYNTKDPFGMLLAAGITTMISLQALINIAVATASIPNTGVPLPFISYGGSSLVLMMAGIGILLNISSYPHGPDGPQKTQIEPNEQEFNRRWERDTFALRDSYGLAPLETGTRRVDRAKRRTAGARD